jgi:hypothetical protein
MPALKLIHALELDQFTAALKRYGWHEKDFLASLKKGTIPLLQKLRPKRAKRSSPAP